MCMLRKINPYDSLARVEIPSKYLVESPNKVCNLREYRSKSQHEPTVVKKDQPVFRRGQAIYVAKKKPTSCHRLLQDSNEQPILFCEKQKLKENQPTQIQEVKSLNSFNRQHKLIEQDFSSYLKNHVNNSILQSIQKQQKDSMFMSDAEFFNLQRNRENIVPNQFSLIQSTAIKEQKRIGLQKNQLKMQQLNTRELRGYLERRSTSRNKVRVGFNHFPQDFFK